MLWFIKELLIKAGLKKSEDDPKYDFHVFMPADVHKCQMKLHNHGSLIPTRIYWTCTVYHCYKKYTADRKEFWKENVLESV